MSLLPPVEQRLNRLDRLWLCEAIRLREHHAERLEDSEANRHARAVGGDLAQRITNRALWLTKRDGQLSALIHYQQGARLTLILLASLALLAGAGMATTGLGESRQPINLFWTLGLLLGPHLLMLGLWLLGWGLSGKGSGLSGRLWLWLSAKFARDAQAAQLAPALLVLLQRQNLTRWGLGLLTHGLWLLALLSALVVLLLLLSARRYGFYWETTLLDSEHFVDLTHALGALPALFGFSQPDELLIRASGAATLTDDSARQAWASWLLGVFVVYGLLPRLLLGICCLWRWKASLNRLQLDISLPDYQMLRESLQPDREHLGISDAAPALRIAASAPHQQADGNGALLVAIELDAHYPWPPALSDGVGNAGVLDTREQRQRLLEQLSRVPAARLVIACDPRRSPDRGTLILLGELARSAVATRVWLLPPPPGETLDSERLADWHAALTQLSLAHGDSAPLRWLESGHD